MKTDVLLPLLLSLCFNVFLTIINILNRKDKSKELRSKLTEEMITINTLSMQYPKLKYLYKSKDKLAELKSFGDDEVDRVKSLSYKYLNLLNKFDDYYRIVEYLTDQQKLKKFIDNEMNMWDKIKYRDPKYLRDWLIFYRKTFNANTIGYTIMIDIVSTDHIKRTGDYSSEFAKFVRVLLESEPD